MYEKNDIKKGNKFVYYEEWNFVCVCVCVCVRALSFKEVVIR